MRNFQMVLVAAAILIAGCAHQVQTTSGESYLEKYAHVPVGAGSATGSDEFDINAAVRQAAAIEPVLEFPARIGLVRIANRGSISAIPEAEALHWSDLAERLGDRFGELVPINPLVAQLALGSGQVPKDTPLHVISQIRLVAARQHLDAVLLYEVNTSREIRQNAFAATDFSLITAFVLPSRKIKGEAIGTGLLIDVIQGYPYGTIETRLQEEKLTTLWGMSSKEAAMAERLRASVTGELVTEAEDMFAELRTQLAEQRLEAYRREEQSVTASGVSD